MNAEFIKYLKGWSQREAAMATSEDLEAWATTEGYGINWCESQGLGVQCDDVEIREFPANTPVQEEGVAVLPAGPHSHSLKSVPADCREAGEVTKCPTPLASLSEKRGSKRDRREHPGSQKDCDRAGVRLPSTACDWLRNIGVFLDAGDL